MQDNYSAVVADYVSTIGYSVINSIRNPRNIVIVGLVALVLASSGCTSFICQNFASPSHERSLNDSREGRGLSYICANTRSSEPTRYSR